MIERVRALVGGDAQLALERASRGAAGAAAGGPPAASAAGAAEHLVQRLPTSLRRSRAAAARRESCRSRLDCESSRFKTSSSRKYESSVPTMIERVGLLVGDDLVQAAGLGASARPAARRGRAQLEQLVHALGQLLRGAVVDGLDPHVLPGAADVDFFDDAHHAPDLRRGVGDDQQRAGRVDRDVAVLALEFAEQGHRLVAAHVLQAVQPRDEAIGIRDRLAAGDDRRRLRHDAAAVDDLQEATVRHDGHAVRFEDRQERLVRLFERDGLGRDHRGFDLPHLGAVDEALTGEPADVVHELGQIRVLQVELDQVPARLRPERHVGRLSRSCPSWSAARPPRRADRDRREPRGAAGATAGVAAGAAVAGVAGGSSRLRSGRAAGAAPSTARGGRQRRTQLARRGAPAAAPGILSGSGRRDESSERRAPASAAQADED